MLKTGAKPVRKTMSDRLDDRKPRRRRFPAVKWRLVTRLLALPQHGQARVASLDGSLRRLPRARRLRTLRYEALRSPRRQENRGGLIPSPTH